ncbi:SNF2 family N-terminal domain-containing protein [Trametes punicea]|nr:SNF2 family N-terminal domain-containing protein [Trametes punicea]
MSARRKYTHRGTFAGSSGKSDEGVRESKPASSCTESVEEVRAQWVQDRREELDRVFDAHDTLIREAFHLEKFVSLLTYDPKVAKQDRSHVFQMFQAQYDLVDHTSSAGPSRRNTRGAHTERLHSLKAPATAVPSPPPAKKPRKEEESPSVAFWNIKAEAKSKGKQAHGESKGPTPSSSLPRKGKGKQPFVEISPRHAAVHRTISPIHERAVTDRPGPSQPMDNIPGDGLAPPPPRKKRRVAVAEHYGGSSARRSLRSAAPVPDHSSDVLDESMDALSSRLVNGAALPEHSKEPSLSPVKHPIQRVKLIVRRPAPVYTHPLHRPKPPPFGGSVEALLSSFTYRLHDEVTPEELEKELKNELSIWRRVDKLRREGRMVGERSSFEFRPALSEDAWGHIIREIERPGPKLVNTQRGAVNVATRVKAHWSGASDKERKRLKALARTTMDMVIEEWRKAVYHIREQLRTEREEEERKLGQKHLDAILNQSGQILEVQLHDLAKDSERSSRSRSRSLSTPVALDWSRASDEEGSDATQVSEDEGDEDGSESDSEESGVDVDEGISMLLSKETLRDLAEREARGSRIEARTSTPLLEEDEGHGESGDEMAEELQRDSSSEPTAGSHGSADHDIGSLGEIVDAFVSDRARLPEDANGSAASTTYGVRWNLSMGFDGVLDESEGTPPFHSFNGDTLPLPFEDHAIDGFGSLEDIALKSSQTTMGMRHSPAPPLEGSLITEISPPRAPAHDSDAVAKPHMDVDMDIPRVVSADATPVSATSVTPAVDDAQEENLEDDVGDDSSIPYYLRPYAVAPVEWDPHAKVKPPFLLRGTLRPYQQAGLEWLASIHSRNLNGILADEMGLGKTIQTIALLAHLACDRGIWGPHLIIVPTSVLLNWEMEFKKFLPGFKVLSYHGNSKQRKELRQGWNNKYHFNVCITSYTLASRDAHVFKRKRWYYMILDEAHMIKNFKSQRWNTLLMFRSFRRLLLTGTPLQNNLTELWALLQFLMSGTDFANLKEFGEWFANPLERAIELGAIDDETQQRVSKLHTVLRPYLLRRLKRDVEKELPQKFEHIVMCPLSKRQRFLYDEFMSRAETRHDLQSGVYQKIANILMQLRKVVNHPDLFEVRPIVTSFAMQRSAVADFEIRELLVRRRLLAESDEEHLNFDALGLRLVDDLGESEIAARETRRLDGTAYLPMVGEVPGEPPPADTRTIAGYRKYRAWQQRAATVARWMHIAYLNRLRTNRIPVYGAETLAVCRRFYQPLMPYDVPTPAAGYLTTPEKIRAAVKSYAARAEEMGPIIDRFAFATPAAVARDLPSIALAGLPPEIAETAKNPEFDAPLHRTAVKLQIAFPDPSLLQYDCGKLQVLADLLRERKAGGHRVLIFTQMTRILDILEIFLNLHGYLYLRLDGATKIEDRQYITERFNSDPRIFCFISSSRSGGVGINLTGADTVIFYDSDFNPQMDRQCEDRAHRIGQIRDVHIYRFISQHTVEEALLRKANQKRSLDDLVIQKGEFDWRTLFADANETALTRALGEFEDAEDAQAAQIAAREEMQLVSEDAQDFEAVGGLDGRKTPLGRKLSGPEADKDLEEPAESAEKTEGDLDTPGTEEQQAAQVEDLQGDDGGEEEGRTTVDYMLDFVRQDWEYFSGWNV